MPEPRSGKLYFVIDRSNCGGGLTDRLKAIVGLYYIASCNGLGFKFIHNAHFDMRDYLVPNLVPWSAELSDLPRLPWKRKRFDYMLPFDRIPVLRPDKDYVCRRYIGKNIIEMAGIPDFEAVWGKAFLDLFSPSEKVAAELAKIKMPERYSIINARFINSLGWTENATYNAPLPVGERERLIEAVLDKAEACAGEATSPVIVYSDSLPFLEAAAARGFNICDPGGVGNLMNEGISDRVLLMNFVNFFHMSKAETIYSILHVDGFPSNCLYKTQYPRYASFVGGGKFIRI